ncbi:outer membrane protein [Bernardetia litoralis DSM 6794]|uniref:Outer membrane protein n=1 Tax=Bernardetia litoralis (strain ATCC 23117 / DSM 6794 / NBRC 15988 / NCIMB 1366 / Fx l1 / Sio-4) TaxID=880071 RepID=I4AP14_BERLS|nr:TolC family protein [Bernardetia litoralis]AFM05699.1 outer membrane protein [Bernardetia litoralis DSM 6794]
MKNIFLFSYQFYSILVLIFSFSFSFSFAQTNTTQKQVFKITNSTLTLQEAISKSLANNYGILIEKEKVSQATLNNNWGETGRYPTINLLLQQNNAVNDVDNPASFLSGITINNSIQPAVDVSWVIFNGFRTRIAKHRLEQLQEESEGNAQIVIQNAIQAIILGYYRVILEKERIDVLKKVLNYSRDRNRYSEVQIELGTATTAETLLTKTNFLTDSINFINQELVYRNAVRDLNVLMGEKDVEQVYEINEKLQAPAQIYQFADLEKQMIEANPDLNRLLISQAILHDATLLNQAAITPQLSLSAGNSYNYNRQDLSQATFSSGQTALIEPINAKTTNYFVNFNLSFTLFNGGQLKRAVQRAKISENIGNLTIDQNKLTLSRDLAKAFDLYNVRRNLLSLSTESKNISEQNLQILEERYNSGLINSFDYRQIQNAFQDAAFNELQAIYNLIDANTTLIRLTGGLTQE